MKLMWKEIKRKLKFVRAEFVFLFFANRDTDVKELLKLQIASNYLLKKYIKPYFEKQKIELIPVLKEKTEQTAWIYWEQGISKAPKIVKVCINSAKKAFQDAGWSVIVLDAACVRNYVDIPDYIWIKYKKGIISEAHFSDLIRLSLLTKWGGCWCDATVLFTGELPKYVYAHDFFVFRGDLRNNKYSNISNWLIYSKRSHPLLLAVQDILWEFWKREDIPIQYFMFHLIFKLVTDYYSEYWESLPIYSNVLPHLLQVRLLQDYSESFMSEICQITTIHKLFWKTSHAIPKDSYYSRILLWNE